MYQIYFIWSNTLHVSDGLSVHHQQFKTVHTATGICQTNAATAVCLLAGTRWSYRSILSCAALWTPNVPERSLSSHLNTNSTTISYRVKDCEHTIQRAEIWVSVRMMTVSVAVALSTAWSQQFCKKGHRLLFLLLFEGKITVRNNLLTR